MTGFPPIPFEELYHKLCVSGAAVGHQSSDMLVEDNLYTRRVLKDYGIKVQNQKERDEEGWSASLFRSSVDGTPFLEVPFIFNDKSPQALFNDALQNRAGMSNAANGEYNVFHHIRQVMQHAGRAVDTNGFDQLAENISQSDDGVGASDASKANAAQKRSAKEAALGLVSTALAAMTLHGRPAVEAIFDKVCHATGLNYRDDPEMIAATNKAKKDFLIGTAELTVSDICESLPDEEPESADRKRKAGRTGNELEPKPPGAP